MSEPVVVTVLCVSTSMPPDVLAVARELIGRDEPDSPPRRDRAVVARAVATLAIAARLGVDPTTVRFGAEPGGRPVVDGVALSLSYSGGAAAVALGDPGLLVGVDIERIRPHRSLDSLARRVFPAAGYDEWRTLRPADQERAFTARWTEVEAVLKARGTGIAGGIATAVESPPGWTCRSVPTLEGYAAALAVDRPSVRVENLAFDLGAELRGRDGTAR